MTTTTATAAAPASPRTSGRRRARPSLTEVDPPAADRRAADGTVRQVGVVDWLEYVALAALAFVPLLVVDRGVVTSDTKTYLYLDPSRFLSQVASMWNPDRGPRDGHPRVHRLPAADGAVLRAGRRGPRADVGGPAAVARRHPVRRRGRRPLPLSGPRGARPRSGRRRAGLHAVAVLPPVRRPHLGHPPALGRPALDGRLRRPGPAPAAAGGTRPSSPSSSPWSAGSTPARSSTSASRRCSG